MLAIVFSANLTYSSKSINTPLPEKSFSELTSIYPEQQITNNAQTFKQLTQALAQSTKQQDTAKVIKTLIDLGDIERFRGNFEASFDYLWTALLYAEESKNNIHMVQIKRNIGILYDIYNQDSLAFLNLNEALNISKKLCNEGKMQSMQLIPSYFSIATHYRQLKQYDLALVYLDSCVFYSLNKEKQPYTSAEKGAIYLNQGKYEPAARYIYQSFANIPATDTRFRVIVYSYLGDLHHAKQSNDSALHYYLLSLKEMEVQNTYIEFKPDLLKKISQVYHAKGNLNSAYSYLQKSLLAYDSLFSATNRRNNQLFEIKNKYKAVISEKEAFIQHQNTTIAYKNKIQQIMGIIAFLILIICIAMITFIRLRVRINKLALTQKIEADKNSVILEIKSKEIAAYTLQMIEKEQAMRDLLEVIKQASPADYTHLQQKHVKSNENLWNDFNRRFIEINHTFYATLREKHPNLSPTELKHCALIKLNLDSLEMAQILNISLQSVHTSRYRIRKKLGLGPDENLTQYIAAL